MALTANTATAYGLEMLPLLEKEVPLEAIVLLKVLDEEGQPGVAVRTTEGLGICEQVGLLTVALDSARERASEGWIEDEE